MERNYLRLMSILFCLSFITLFSCDLLNEKEDFSLPELETFLIKAGMSDASCQASLYSDGNDSITSKGICWATHDNPTIDDFATNEGAGKVNFISEIEGLNSNTVYYARAYATNSAETGYGNTIILKTMYGTVTDIDGNEYFTVKIGDQIWMAENLKVSHFRNGEIIPQVPDSSEWAEYEDLESGCWCYPENKEINNEPLGKLYNYYAVIDSRDISPAGWHVPTKNDWLVLVSSLGGKNISGQKMKADNTLYWGGDRTSDNSSGFSAIPAGDRVVGYFEQYGLVFGAFNGPLVGESHWWSVTEITSSYNDIAFSVMLASGNDDIIYQESSTKGNGYSVRCVKD